VPPLERGVDFRSNKRTLRPIAQRIGAKKIKKFNGRTEELLEEWEVSKIRPPFSATITVADRGVILLVDGLYWGTRRLIEHLVRDEVRMAKAVDFLGAGRVEPS
jgi:hypothetical protein